MKIYPLLEDPSTNTDIILELLPIWNEVHVLFPSGSLRTLLLAEGIIILFVPFKVSFSIHSYQLALEHRLYRYSIHVPHTESSPVLLLHMESGCRSLMGSFWPSFSIVLMPLFTALSLYLLVPSTLALESWWKSAFTPIVMLFHPYLLLSHVI